ncbi:MAG: hypothetical protein J1E43_11480 [Christensenellaceae bacterium]|nr:hypothetical protein [Christensenellaceae bacterium]
MEKQSKENVLWWTLCRFKIIFHGKACFSCCPRRVKKEKNRPKKQKSVALSEGFDLFMHLFHRLWKHPLLAVKKAESFFFDAKENISTEKNIFLWIKKPSVYHDGGIAFR